MDPTRTTPPRPPEPRRRRQAERLRPTTRHPSPLSTPQSWWARISLRGGRIFGWHGWPKVASLATTVAAVGALWFSGQSLRANENQYQLSEQGLLTERFSRAVEQLGSSALDVRLGAVYSLERLSRDSVRDHPTIFEVLGAFVRTHSPVTPGCAESPDPLAEPRPSVDVQAALTAIGRRNADHDGPNAIDLSASCLAGASLTDADLYDADLAETVLAYADLRGTDLTAAHLTDVDLYGADLTGATLIGTEFREADLTGIVYDASTTWTDGTAPPPPAVPR